MAIGVYNMSEDEFIQEDDVDEEEWVAEELKIEVEAAIFRERVAKKMASSNSTAPLSSPTPFSARMFEQEKAAFSKAADIADKPRVEYIPPRGLAFVTRTESQRDHDTAPTQPLAAPPAAGVWVMGEDSDSDSADETTFISSQVLPAQVEDEDEDHQQHQQHRQTTVWAAVGAPLSSKGSAGREAEEATTAAADDAVSDDPPPARSSAGGGGGAGLDEAPPNSIRGDGDTEEDRGTHSLFARPVGNGGTVLWARTPSTGASPQLFSELSTTAATEAESLRQSPSDFVGLEEQEAGNEGSEAVDREGRTAGEEGLKVERGAGSKVGSGGKAGDVAGSVDTYSVGSFENESVAGTESSKKSRMESKRGKSSKAGKSDYGETDDDSAARFAALVESTSAARIAAGGSENQSDYGDVVHPHTFALQLLTHDLRNIPASLQKPGSPKKKQAQWREASGTHMTATYPNIVSWEATHHASAYQVTPWTPAGAKPLQGRDPVPPSSPKPSQAKQLNRRKSASALAAGADEWRESHIRSDEKLLEERAPSDWGGDGVNLHTSLSDSVEASRFLGAVDKASRSSPYFQPAPSESDQGSASTSSAWAKPPQRPASAHPYHTPRSSPLQTSKPRPASAHPGGRVPNKSESIIEGYREDAWPVRLGYGGEVRSEGGAAPPITAEVSVTGFEGPVSVYMAESLKRISEANRWSAALGSDTRYRLDDLSRSMMTEVYSVQNYWGDEAYAMADAPALSSISSRQFLKEHGQLKVKHQKLASAQKPKPRRTSLSLTTSSAMVQHSNSTPTSPRDVEEVVVSRPGQTTRAVHRPTSARYARGGEERVPMNSRPASARPASARPASARTVRSSLRPASASCRKGTSGGNGKTRAQETEEWREVMEMCNVKEDTSKPWGWALV